VKKPTSQIHALIIALIGCFLLVEFGILIWKFTIVYIEFLPLVLLLFILLCFGLVSYIIFESFRVKDEAKVLAKTMTESMLVTSHELFSELYRSSPVPYMLIDAEGIVESTNVAASRLFNVKGGNLNSTNIFSLISGKDENKMALIPEYYKQGKFINDLEVQIRCPDGTKKWVMFSLFSFQDADHIRKGLLTLVDITKQKLIDHAKTEFVSLASHQLRTPISAMQWNLELLKSEGKNSYTEKERLYMDKISRGLERMNMLVSDFLSASKLELGTLIPELKQIEFAEFLKAIYDEHLDVSVQREIHLKTDWDKAPGTIVSDPHLLHMVVSNILGNALKYTKPGGEVRLFASQDETKITISISDTGIGIPLDDQKMLFTKLYRATNARTHATEGTGLGLYLVKEIVRILNGKVSFESEPGVGTIFIIMLRK
jgi:PAS domain S-box-containing protein